MDKHEAPVSGYAAVHANRRNLLIHLATQPLFVAGLATTVIAPFGAQPWLAALGPIAMLLAIAAQGRGHAFEARTPQPFTGAWDFFRRLFAEQLIGFPRFVVSGEFARAWRGALPLTAAHAQPDQA